jgi:hypothetical protein
VFYRFSFGSSLMSATTAHAPNSSSDPAIRPDTSRCDGNTNTANDRGFIRLRRLLSDCHGLKLEACFCPTLRVQQLQRRDVITRGVLQHAGSRQAAPPDKPQAFHCNAGTMLRCRVAFILRLIPQRGLYGFRSTYLRLPRGCLPGSCRRQTET